MSRICLTLHVVFLMGLVMHIVPARGGEEVFHNRFSGGGGYVGMGGYAPDMQSLNRFLPDDQGTVFKRGVTIFGGGGHLMMGNVLIGGEGFGLIPARNAGLHGKSELKGGFGLLQIGYMFWLSKGIAVAPRFGIGAGHMEVLSEFADGDPGPVPPPGGTAKVRRDIEHQGLIVDISVLATGVLIGARDDRDRSGIFLGLKTGYLLDLSPGNWTYNGKTADGNSPVSLGGPYISIVLGGGAARNINIKQ